MHFIFKTCQTLASISMICLFHEFFNIKGVLVLSQRQNTQRRQERMFLFFMSNNFFQFVGGKFDHRGQNSGKRFRFLSQHEFIKNVFEVRKFASFFQRMGVITVHIIYCRCFYSEDRQGGWRR